MEFAQLTFIIEKREEASFNAFNVRNPNLIFPDSKWPSSLLKMATSLKIDEF